jgi:hypothetical protein
MKKNFFAIPAAMVMLLALAAAAQTDFTTTSTAQSLIANSKTLLEALKTGNVSAAQPLLTADFRFIGSEGKWHSRADFVDNVKDADLKDYRMYNVEAILLNADAVLVTFDCIIHQSEGDYGLAPRYQHISDTWVKSGDQWQLKFQQSSPLRPID